MGRASGQRAEGPALVVRDAAEAAAVLRLAAGRPVVLLSGRSAAGWLGAAGWRALVEAAAAASPGTPFTDLLCCGDAPGQALAALRAGCRGLVLDGACPAFTQVAAAAAEHGATLLPGRPPALDCAPLDLSRPGAQAVLRRWIGAAADDSARDSG